MLLVELWICGDYKGYKTMTQERYDLWTSKKIQKKYDIEISLVRRIS